METETFNLGKDLGLSHQKGYLTSVTLRFHRPQLWWYLQKWIRTIASKFRLIFLHILMEMQSTM